MIRIFFGVKYIFGLLKAGSFKHIFLAQSGVYGNCLQTLFELLLPGVSVASSLVSLHFLPTRKGVGWRLL